jgi:hypothetical protein
MKVPCIMVLLVTGDIFTPSLKQPSSFYIYLVREGDSKGQVTVTHIKSCPWYLFALIS